MNITFKKNDGNINSSNDILAWSKEYLSEPYKNAPRKFLEKYWETYEAEKKRIFSPNTLLDEFKKQLPILSKDFYNFLALDWQTKMIELIEKRSPYIFEFILFLDEKITIKDSYAFKRFQDFINEDGVLNELVEKTEGHLKIKKNENNQWTKIEAADKTCYILKIDCATYVRSVETTKEFTTLDVCEGVVKTSGLEFKSQLPFDEIIYYEV